MKVTVEQEIPESRIRDLLTCALEGGSNYWYEIVGYILPDGICYQDFREGGKFTTEDYYHPTELIPFLPGCALQFRNPFLPGGALQFRNEVLAGKLYLIDSQKILLNLETIQRGLESLAKKYPKAWANFIDENEDAETGDMFLQCCLFGEVIVG
jgi:hypothetical protein